MIVFNASKLNRLLAGAILGTAFLASAASATCPNNCHRPNKSQYDLLDSRPKFVRMICVPMVVVNGNKVSTIIKCFRNQA
jgi:hypothetical protein